MGEEQTAGGYLDTIVNMVIEYAPKVALAIILLLVGFRIINKVVQLAAKAVQRAGVAENILPFIRSITSIALKVLLIFTVASVLGVDVTGFVAVLAAASFAVGLALQGSLGNFAAGIIILIFRPYKIGDWVQIDDYFGKVNEIQIFNTLLTTPGRKTLFVPNGQVIENVVTNYTTKGHIRLEVQLLMAYEEDFPRLKSILFDAVQASPYTLEEPQAMVGIESFDTHNIVVGVRPFVDPDHYWDATFDVHSRIKQALSENGIKMAYSEGVELGPIGG
ncbi:MAG: mechanosensitive ion channel [Bacteroidota bacterium]